MRSWSMAAVLGLTSVALLSACGGGTGNQSQIGGNAGDNPQTFDSLSVFDPVPISPADSASIPFPFDGLFAGFSDPTLNIPNPRSAPFVTAANLGDGFSTTASLFFDMTGFVDLATVTPNLLIVNSATGAVLKPGIDYALQGSPATTAVGTVQVPINQQRTRVLIEPLKPLSPSTRYLVAFKTGAKNSEGKGVLASAAFRVLRSATPVSQQSEPVLGSYNAAQKATLEQLRSQLIRPVVEAFGQLAGIPETDLVLAWSFTTASTDKTLKALAATATPRFTQLQNTGANTSIIGAPGIADIYSGVIQVPYYLANSGGDTHSTAPLSTFWAADATKPDTAAKFLGQVPCGAFAVGATLPDGQTAKPSVSTTLCFPLPVKKTDELIPLLVTVPNANSGQTKPANGWPVVIFQHGITRNRGDALPVAPALAAAGFVVVAIDLPLHGIAPGSTFAALRQAGRERTFDLDLVNNSTTAPGPDGTPDGSGQHFINLASLITSRDNLRQAEIDLVSLSKSIAGIDTDGDGTPDLDASQVRFLGHSLGGVVGGTYLALDDSVGAATLAMPGMGIGKLLDASNAFGPVISAGLAASGLNEGTDDYETFIRFAQTIVDAADPVNYLVDLKAKHPLHLIEVVNDTTLPNVAVAGPTRVGQDKVTLTGFLSGTDPMVALLGLDVIGPLSPPLATATQKTGAKLAVATVFATGNHGSILDPSGSDINAATTQEMQRQTANFLKSNGQCLPTGGNCQ
ncbi:MAG: hypothetical protein Q7J29_00590 [Stagnimonas sp.]|nr:hypothetical protein [Stagnimonas sp.]